MHEVIIKPETISYTTLCTHYGSFIVPRFQRLYSWKNKQVQNFFSSIVENERGYFIGTLVGFSEDPGEAGSNLNMVDGQQRITTINLLLVALKKILKKFDKHAEVQKEIKMIDRILTYIDASNDKLSNRLSPWKETLQKVYSDILEGVKTEKPDSNQRIYIKNYYLLSEMTEDFVVNDFRKAIELSEKIRSLKFIQIICRSEIDVQSIYEGLNSTGLPLSVSDLVKNKVISACPEEQRDSIEDRWEEIEALFAKVDFSLLPKFLRHNWISEHGYINNKDLYQAIIKEITRSENKPIQYVNQLLNDSRTYLGIYGVADCKNDLQKLFRDHENILNILNNFQYLGNTQVYSVLLAYIKKFQSSQNKIKPKVLLYNIDKLWNFCFRSQYVSINPSAYEKIFANMCKVIKNTNSDEIANKTKEEFKKLSRLVSNSEQFIKFFADDISYSSDKKLIEIIFLKIFESEQHEITMKDVSVEHIVPQNPKKWGLTKSYVKDFVHNIGNLTLLHSKDNSKASDETVEIKYEKIYKNSHFKFNKDFKKYLKYFDDDPKKAVADRAKDIACIAEQLFKL